MFKKKSFLTQAVPYKMPSLDTERAVIVEEDNPDAAVFESRGSEDIEREAYERGFESGQIAGFEMGEQKALLLMQRLEKAINDIVVLREKELKNLQMQALELSLAIAKKIVIKELTLNPDVIADITKEALTRLQRTGQIIIKINPALKEIFIKNKPELLSVHHDIVFELDAGAPLYGAEVIGPDETVMTDVEEQFSNIIDEMGVRLARD